MSSIKGKADLWRTGKAGAGPDKSGKEVPGGSTDFAATSKFSNYKAKLQNLPSSIDNQEVFANSTAGLAKDDKVFLPDPGEGRDGLDMYSIAGNDSKDGMGLDVARAPNKKFPGEY